MLNPAASLFNVMEEIEIPTEHLREQIQDKASELLRDGESKSSLYIAVCTALMAVLAAIAGLMAGHHSNEALIDQIRASDQWAFYQAKSIKAEIRLSRLNTGTDAVKSTEQTKKEEEEIRKNAGEYEYESKVHLQHHVWLAASVTLFQIAIAISAISLLTKRKGLWLTGMAIAFCGLVLFLVGLIW